MPPDKKTIYCSLDIETSDFDPVNGEILELGMVFFDVEKKRLKIISQWQSVFKPSKAVPPKILALTGISESELESAPYFREKSEEIQKLVKDAVIIGHNIDFDINFLKGFGIKFSGEKIDTLYLAQMLLPTQSSYNLEALMHLLEVPHADAHRALADAKAVVYAIEKFLAHFAAFPEDLKKELRDMFSGKFWKPLEAFFETEFAPKSISIPAKPFNFEFNKSVASAISGSSKVLSFPLGFDYYSNIFGSISQSKEKVLLVVPDKMIVYKLWQKGLAYPVFSNRDVFNRPVFEKTLKKRTNKEQKYFFGKILVWKNTNWQTQVLYDLNMSFLGNQFRDAVSYEPGKKLAWPLAAADKVVAADYSDFVELDLGKKYSKRKVIILDINGFEQALSALTSVRVSWHDFIYAFKQVYNPEKNTGQKELAELSHKMLSETDLFFGLANLKAKKFAADSYQILIDKTKESNNDFAELKSAALNFSEKIESAAKKFKSQKLKNLAADLAGFFDYKENIVRWLEIGENRFTFASSPIDLSEIAQQKLKIFKKIIVTASLGSPALIDYFQERLSLQNLKVETIGQQQLRKKFEVVLAGRNNIDTDLLGLLKNIQAPAALLLNNSTAVRDFYETNFKELQKNFKVLAMGFSGGSNKLIENFSIQNNSLLIATDNFVLKLRGKNLKVRTLILSRLPFEQFNHPLFAAQAEKYPNKFLDFNIPRALYNFHAIVKFFFSDDLEKIHILDPKIHKEYGKYFIDYLKTLPFVEIKE